MATATTTRTWNETLTACKAEWLRSDGQAVVTIRGTAEGWTVCVYEATGRDSLDHPASYIGSEPPSPTRGGAVAVARRWVKKLTRPARD